MNVAMLGFSNFISYSPSNGALAAPPSVEFQDGHVAKCLCCVSNREQRLVSQFTAQWERQIAEELAPRRVHALCKRQTAGSVSHHLVSPCTCLIRG
jgi:hypothetical protein